MSCVYQPSDVFQIATDDNFGRRPNSPTVKIVPIVPGDCWSGYKGLSTQLNQDILYQLSRVEIGFEMPTFILLAHQYEWTHPELTISEYVKNHVEVRDISMGWPYAYNHFVYITDPAAIGFPNVVREMEVLNSPLKNAVQITYIQAQE
jgi:hypothetical protein